MTSTGRQTVDLAIGLYIQRATADSHWQQAMRQGVDRIMEELSEYERDRVFDYVEGFDVEAALFPIKRMVEIYPLALQVDPDGLFGRRMDRARKQILRFRADFLIPPPGQEEGRRPSDTPHATYHAAARRRQGTDTPAEFQQMVASTIDMIMRSFGRQERQQIGAWCERLPVGAATSVLRSWTWIGGEDVRKKEVAHRQLDRWRKTGDDSIWWQIAVSPRDEESFSWFYF